MAYSHGSPEDDQLTWSDREGKVLGTIGESGEYEDPALSPDGSGLAVTKPTSETVSNIWLLDLSRGTNTRFTFGSALDSDPVWSPDGGRIIFSSMRKGGRGLYLKVVSGIKEEEVLLKPGEARYPTSWSHDGRFLLYQERNPSAKLNIWVLPLEGDRKPVQFVATEFSEGDAHFSPDGRWVAYVSDESGQPEVYVRSFSLPGTTASGETVKYADVKFQISNGPGFQPRWRADGRELFYRSIPNGKVMAVEIAAGPAFRAGAPRAVGNSQPLFQGWPSPGSRWDSSPDGKRFLTLTTVPTKPKPLSVVLNWQSGLKN
jgi:eukaryotic-like serine/threonine-protein kinase